MKNMFEDLPEGEEREGALSDNASFIEQGNVKRYYTKDELIELRENVSDVSIEKSGLEDELKKLSAPIKLEIKEKQGALKELLKKVKNKFFESEEKMYLFADQQEGLMLCYDRNGKFLHSRGLRPEERQTTIIEMKSKQA